MILKDLVKAIAPDFPSDRKVVETSNSEVWFKIDVNTNTMYVPTLKVLRFNMMILEKFGEALLNYSASNGNESTWDWNNLVGHTAQTEEETLEWIARLPDLAVDSIIGCDIESKYLAFEGNRLLSIGFAYSDNEAVAFTVFTERTISAMRELLKSPSITWVWANGKFDVSRLKYMNDIDARVDEDVGLLHYTGINEKKGTHKLKDLGVLYLQAPRWDDELEAFKKQWCREHKVTLENFTYDLIPIATLIPYMLKDCIATRRLLPTLKRLADPRSEFIYRKLIKASNVYARVEMNGVMTDCNYLPVLANRLIDDLEEAQKHVDELVAQIWNPVVYTQQSGAKQVPREFNIKSPKQLKWLLERAVGHAISSTDEESITMLLDEVHSRVTPADTEHAIGTKFLDALMVSRKFNKQLDTYVNGIMKVMGRDGRIRCSYNLHGTETGRLSSNNPNMQNIPRDKTIKNLFIPKAGYKLLQFDYSQAELRVLTVLSKEPYLEAIYREGRDLHSSVATDMFGAEYTKEERTRVKEINFGVPFGVGAGRLSASFGISITEAQSLIRRWYQPMPTLVRYLAEQRRKAARGEECISLFGRRRHFVLTNENLYHIQNEFINMPVQSVASDCTVMSILDLQDWIDAVGLQDYVKIIITVHDSIVLEIIDIPEIIDAVAVEGCRIMAEIPTRYIPDLTVPFKADVETGYKWGEMKEYTCLNQELTLVENLKFLPTTMSSLNAVNS